MNLRGSYRALLQNSISALLCAIEIYNKPQLEYRDETFSVLLINAWELLLKAILSKNKQRIYYPKRKNEPYRTYALSDALKWSAPYFPPNIHYQPTRNNILALVEYRDNTIHFYNEPEFGIIVYGLAQTCVINYRDLTLRIFGIDVAEKTTLKLLPLAFGTPPDPITFLRQSSENPSKSKIVAAYIDAISQVASQLEHDGFDTGRFLTVFSVSLQSVKKISSADVIAGIVSPTDSPEIQIVKQRVDPNQSHPLRRKDILERIGEKLQNVAFNTRTFEALAWKYQLKSEPRYFWCPSQGGTAQYSHDTVRFFHQLTQAEIIEARKQYGKFLSERRKN